MLRNIIALHCLSEHPQLLQFYISININALPIHKVKIHKAKRSKGGDLNKKSSREYEYLVFSQSWLVVS